MSINKLKSVNLGRNRAGLKGSVAYRLINSGGSVTTARTNTGVTEVGSGIYFCDIAFPNDWRGLILWDDGQASRLYASDIYSYLGPGADIGSTVWSKNPNNFTAADTFGQRITKIMQRASSGGVSVMGGLFSPQEKKELFNWLDATFERMKKIEEIMASFPKKITGEIDVTLQVLEKNFTELQRYNKKMINNSMEESKMLRNGVQKDVGLLVDSLKTVVMIKKSVNNVGVELETLKRNIGSLHNTENKTLKLIESDNKDGQFFQVKNLIGSAIVATEKLKDLTAKILDLQETRAEDAKITDQAILKLVPDNKLKELIEK